VFKRKKNKRKSTIIISHAKLFFMFCEKNIFCELSVLFLANNFQPSLAIFFDYTFLIANFLFLATIYLIAHLIILLFDP